MFVLVPKENPVEHANFMHKVPGYILVPDQGNGHNNCVITQCDLHNAKVVHLGRNSLLFPVEYGEKQWDLFNIVQKNYWLWYNQ